MANLLATLANRLAAQSFAVNLLQTIEYTRRGIGTTMTMYPEVVPPKSRWDKIQNWIQSSIPALAVFVTAVFGYAGTKVAQSNLRLAEAQMDVARTQIEVALIPALSSENATQRALGTVLATALDREFGDKVATILLLTDQAINVRQAAESVLVKSARSSNAETAAGAKSSLNRFAVLEAVRAQGLSKRIENANALAGYGDSESDRQALRLYHEVLDALATTKHYELLLSLDQEMLRHAQLAEQTGVFDQAVRYYRALFSALPEGPTP